MDWRKGLEPGGRLRARIVYIDAAAKRVCLSLLPHLVAARADPAELPPVNALFEARAALAGFALRRLGGLALSCITSLQLASCSCVCQRVGGGKALDAGHGMFIGFLVEKS